MEVDVSPLQPEELALAEAGIDRGADKGGVVVASLRLPGELLRC
jgi:hypothetical protein